MTNLNTSGEHACFSGTVSFHAHHSSACDAEMSFAVYVPPQAAEGPVPVLYYLAGLTSTEETFVVKGGAQRVAAECGLMLVAPDTSPRGLGLPLPVRLRVPDLVARGPTARTSGARRGAR